MSAKKKYSSYIICSDIVQSYSRENESFSCMVISNFSGSLFNIYEETEYRNDKG